MQNGKTAIVTGASGGIGAAIVRKLAADGYNVAILYGGNREKAEAVKQSVLDNTDVKAEIFACDVADAAQCKAVVAEIIAAFGSIEVLVNNAGITRDNLILTMREEEFDAVINTNLKGCFHMIQSCCKHFLRKKYGKIINIASVSGLLGTAGQANYAASKAGLIAMTKTAARELAGKNICCNAVAPGFIETAMTQDLKNREQYLNSIPLKRAGQPEDVANTVAFLASDASDYITGTVIRVDGGLAI